MFKTKKIEKSWCVCGTGFIDSYVFGKIIQESEDRVEVVYSERPNVPSEFRYPRYIKRFKTTEGAIKELLKLKKHFRGIVFEQEERERIKDNFPSAFKEDSV